MKFETSNTKPHETSNTESTHLYTLKTEVFFPEETTPRELISPRSIKVGGE